MNNLFFGFKEIKFFKKVPSKQSENQPTKSKSNYPFDSCFKIIIYEVFGTEDRTVITLSKRQNFSVWTPS